MQNTLKYTKMQEEELRTTYTTFTTHSEREEYIERFMSKHNKTKRSVVAKLSKMRIYINRPKTSKVTGDIPETKKQMLDKIAFALGINPEKLEGMDKSPKLALLNLLKRVT